MPAFMVWLANFGPASRRLKSALVVSTISFLPAVLAGEQTKGPTLKAPAAENWKIQIIPGPAIGPSPVPTIAAAARQAAAKAAETSQTTGGPLGQATSGAAPASEGSSLPAGVTPSSYAEIYNSIPFRRSEYLANPSYRHEATIEILLGQVRPKTVVVSPPAPTTTCCSPQPTSLIGVFNPWGAKNFYYHYSYSRPSSYWVW